MFVCGADWICVFGWWIPTHLQPFNAIALSGLTKHSSISKGEAGVVHVWPYGGVGMAGVGGEGERGCMGRKGKV